MAGTKSLPYDRGRIIVLQAVLMSIIRHNFSSLEIERLIGELGRFPEAIEGATHGAARNPDYRAGVKEGVHDFIAGLRGYLKGFS